MMTVGNIKAYSDISPILWQKTHCDSFGSVHHPDEAKAIGRGNTDKEYRKYCPNLYEIAEQLATLSSNASRVQLNSHDASPSTLRGLPTNETRRTNKIGKSYQSDQTKVVKMMSILLGRKRLQIINAPATIDSKGPALIVIMNDESQHKFRRSEPLTVNYFLQPLPFSMDNETGEIFDDVALEYVARCNSTGLLAQLYKLSDNELCAFVVLGNDYSHADALTIATKLASNSPGVSVKWSSLREYVYSPLSLSNDCYLCSWYDRSFDESSDILQSLIDFKGPKLDLTQLTGEPASDPFIAAFIQGTQDEDETSSQDELPDLPSLNDQPLPKPKDWIVSAAFRRECVEALGTDDPDTLKLLGWWLWGWRDKTVKLSIASDESIASLLGWENKLSSKRPIVKPALEKLKAVTRVDEIPHNYKGRATTFDLPDVPYKLIDLGKEFYRPVTDPVLLGTGARTREHIKKQDIWRRGVAEQSSTSYPSNVSAGLIENLNNLPANYYRKLTTTHWETLMERALCMDDEGRDSALKTLRHIQFHPQPIYKKAHRTSRIYTVGHSYQNLNRNLRNIAFSGCLKVDLKHSQLSIACWMYEFHEIDELLKNGTAWNYLCGRSGLSKDKIKTILYSTLYMRSLEFDPYSHPALKNEKATREELRMFIGVKEFQYLIRAREKYIKYKLDDVKMDAFNNQITDEDYHCKLAILSQSYELKILESAIDYVRDLKQNNICLWLHDGFYINGNSTKFDGISKKLKSHVENSVREFGINTSLESSC